MGNYASKLTVNYGGGCHCGRNSQSQPRICWKEGLELSKRGALFPLWPLPHRQCHNSAKRVALHWRIPKAPPPYNIISAQRQRNMAQMKEQIKTPEKELSNEETANLSDAEFKMLVIRMSQK